MSNDEQEFALSQYDKAKAYIEADALASSNVGVKSTTGESNDSINICPYCETPLDEDNVCNNPDCELNQEEEDEEDEKDS